MSIIKSNVQNSGVTTYKIDLAAVKKLVATDLAVPVGAVSVEPVFVRRGETYQSDGYDEFSGLIIKVDNSVLERK